MSKKRNIWIEWDIDEFILSGDWTIKRIGTLREIRRQVQKED